MLKKNTLIVFALFLFVGVTNTDLMAQMSKDLVKTETAPAAIENTDGEPELLSYKDRLILLIEKEPIFLSPEISDTEIARLLRTTPSVVETIMESDFGQDYDTFINSRRVKSAAEFLLHPDFRLEDYEDKEAVEYMLTQISNKCGFKSKGVFVRMFRRHHKLSVTDFIEKEVIQVLDAEE